ncbi:hypothetical protein C7B63_10725 [Bacillus halotolerans]|nr:MULTISPECIES: DUF6773 family protein [Bacillus]AUZ28475.1 hypothetical protein C1T25_20560 [Bacillus cereus]PAO70510.1 hypothetical protein CIK44_00670 [Bacillus sp. X2(2017)]POO82112.1 hypothetical protein C1T30_10635 [Bacillus sp. MBGLi97]MBU2659410.1 hypothetical protein [Bacillus cabrialesii]MCK8099430.1 hypothetical protein [Bacillus sp. 2CMS4F]
MKDERISHIENKIGHESFLLVIALVFVSFILSIMFKMPSTLMTIIILFVGSGYYGLRAMSKGILRVNLKKKKKSSYFLLIVFTFILYMATSVLFKIITFPFTTKEFLFQILMYILWLIPFSLIMYTTYKFSNRQQKKELEN